MMYQVRIVRMYLNQLRIMGKCTTNHFRHGSLFSGIGGFDLAAEWMGWENVFHCEWMPFPRKVLNHYWPNSISYEDITKTDFSIHRGTIDILTGGFPCQPFSSAGKRLGKEDERHLWPHMLRAIREIEPTFVVGENVRGLTNWNGGVVFEEVCSDLETCGYEVQPLLLPACAVNAPHRRDRIWFVANSINNRHNTIGGKISKENRVSRINREKMESRESNGTNLSRNASDSDGKEQTNNKGTNGTKADEIWRQNESDVLRELCSDGMASNSECIRLEHSSNAGEISGKKTTSSRQRSKSSLSIETNVYGYKSKWENFPTISPICDGNDGISDRLDSITFPKWRNESIKAGGNAIVPQVAYQIFKSIQYLTDNENQNQL